MDESHERLLGAVSELYELTPDLFSEEEVREEVYDLAVTRYRQDRFVSLADLLSDGTAESYEPKYGRGEGIRHAGAFQKAFEARFDPDETPELARFVDRLSTGSISARSGAKELFLYCPYCDDIDSQTLDEVTVAPALGQPGPSAEGKLITGDGASTISVDEPYAQENYTLQVTATQGGTSPTAMLDDPLGPGSIEIHCYDDSDLLGDKRVCCTYIDGVNQGCNTTRDDDDDDGGSGGGDPDPVVLWEDCDERSRVFTGEIMLTDHSDGFWSIIDGGGDEVRVGQIGVENIVQTDDGRFEATNFTRLTPVRYINRGQISDEDEIWWGVELVTEWDCEDGDRFFVAYDEDPNAETEFAPSFTLSATVPIGGVPVEVGTTIGLGEVTIETQDDVHFSQALPRDNFFELNRDGERGCGTEPVPAHAADFFDRVDFTKFCMEGSRDAGYLTLPDVYDR